MPDKIIIRPYRLIIRDHVSYTVSVSCKSLITFPGIITYPLSAVFVAGLINAPSLMKGEYVLTILWAIGFLTLWLGVIPGIGLWRTWKSAKDNPAMTGFRTLQIDDNGVHIHGEGFESHVAWQSFKTVLETKSYVILSRTNEAHIVPTSAFSTPEDATIFAEQARAHIANAVHAQTGVFYENQPVPNMPTSPFPYDLKSPPYVITFRTFSFMVLRVNLRPFYNPITAGCLFVLWVFVYGWLYRHDLMDGRWEDAFRSASISAVTYLLLPPLSILLGWQKTRNMQVVTNERHLAISQGGIHATGHGYDVYFAWRDLKRMEQFGGVMLFYTPPRGAIPLPNSSFTDKAAARAFYDQALASFNAAKLPAAKSALDG